MNEWQLVAEYAQGDEQAFEALMRRFLPLVYSAAVRQVGEAHLAEEIAQSVFILFARKAAKLPPAVSLTGWMLRTTRFVAKDALKQMNRRIKREREAAELAALHKGWSPDWNGPAVLVDEALLGLAPSDQACVMARFFDGLSFKEIGDIHHISEDGAQKRVSRALDKMRAFLERRGLRVSAVVLTSILGVNFARASEAQLVATGRSTVQSALKGQAGGQSLLLADHAARSLIWRTAMKLGLSVTTGLLLLGGGFIAWHRAHVPTKFQVSDPRIDTLGKAWAVVVQRAAFLVQFLPGGPPAGNPNRAAYDQANAFVIAETQRVSTELNAVLQADRDRAQLAEFLTVELRETLGLDARQQGEVSAWMKERLAQGPALRDGLQTLWNSKGELFSTLRQRLSPEQMQRFNQTYGTNGFGLLAFPLLVLRSGP